MFADIAWTGVTQCTQLCFFIVLVIISVVTTKLIPGLSSYKMRGRLFRIEMTLKNQLAKMAISDVLPFEAARPASRSLL